MTAPRARRLSVAVFVCAVVGMLPTAQAGHCQSSLVVFSGVKGTRLLNPSSLACSTAATAGVVEPPVLMPRADTVQIRDTRNFSNLDQMTVRLSGLGGTRTAVLSKTQVMTPVGSSWVYDSSEISIPDGAGCLRVEIVAPADLAGSPIAYRTVDGSC